MRRNKEADKAYYEAYKQTDAYKAYLAKKRLRYAEDAELKAKIKERTLNTYYANREILKQVKQQLQLISV